MAPEPDNTAERLAGIDKLMAETKRTRDETTSPRTPTSRHAGKPPALIAARHPIASVTSPYEARPGAGRRIVAELAALHASDD
jgi:hypothetical protein